MFKGYVRCLSLHLTRKSEVPGTHSIFHTCRRLKVRGPGVKNGCDLSSCIHLYMPCPFWPVTPIFYHLTTLVFFPCQLCSFLSPILVPWISCGKTNKNFIFGIIIYSVILSTFHTAWKLIWNVHSMVMALLFISLFILSSSFPSHSRPPLKSAGEKCANASIIDKSTLMIL